MWEYSDKVKEHFLNPHNVGELKTANAIGEVGSITCGDALKLMLEVEQNSEKIKAAKFQTFGCGSAIAAASVLTDMLIGRTLSQALEITNQDIAKALDGLPKEKMHCSVMGQEAVKAAIANYRGEKAITNEEQEEIICKCFGVSENKIKKVILENKLTSLLEVTDYTKAGGACRTCHSKIEEMLEKINSSEKSVSNENTKKLTNLQRMRLVQETLEREVKPELRKDGGNLELVDIEGKTVKVRLLGACAGCKVANFTLKDLVGHKLREFVEPDIIVEEIKE